MKRIDVSQLVQTDKGSPVRYKVGDVIGSLKVLNYMGKIFVKYRNLYDPIYVLECDCGTIEMRHQYYLVYRGGADTKCCYACARASSKRAASEPRKGRGRPKSREDSPAIYKTEDYYEQVIKDIFNLPIHEVMK